MKACMSPLQVTRSQQSGRVPDDIIKTREVSTGFSALRNMLAVQARCPKFNPQNPQRNENEGTSAPTPGCGEPETGGLLALIDQPT